MTNLATASAIDRFPEAVTADPQKPEQRFEPLYQPAATLDAVVPGWRFQRTGPAGIAAEYAQWFNHPTTLDEVRRHPTGSGEVLEYTAHWQDNNIHHVHILNIDAQTGLVAEDHVWCGGRWDAALLAQMETQQ
jgi:hypothetical protein